MAKKLLLNRNDVEKFHNKYGFKLNELCLEIDGKLAELFGNPVFLDKSKSCASYDGSVFYFLSHHDYKPKDFMALQFILSGYY